MCTLSHGVAWPINFKLLLLTLHASPRLALTSADKQALGGFTSRSGAFQKGKMPSKHFPPALGAGAGKGLGEEARHNCKERTVREGKACFLHQKTVLQA